MSHRHPNALDCVLLVVMTNRSPQFEFVLVDALESGVVRRAANDKDNLEGRDGDFPGRPHTQAARTDHRTRCLQSVHNGVDTKQLLDL
jgi:hypothetical protein